MKSSMESHWIPLNPLGCYLHSTGRNFVIHPVGTCQCCQSQKSGRFHQTLTNIVKNHDSC
jgi:hypothetical protein